MPYNFGFAGAVQSSLVQQRRMDIISNNIANASTPGFKADRLLFNDLLGREVYTDLSQGPLEATGNALDVAINGEGFFQVQTADGILLSRAGNMVMRADGTLTDQENNPVLGQGGAPIVINPQGSRVYIGDEGQVQQDGETIGVLAVVEPADPNNLEKTGLNYFSAQNGGAPATKPAADASLVQGHLEMSNGQVVREMVGMIDTFRAFESYQKSMHIMQEIDTKAAAQLGRVG